MSKKQAKSVKPSPMLAAQPTTVEPATPMLAEVKTQAAEVVAVLTKRNRVPTAAVLEYTGKKISDRAKHNKLAWEVLAKVLPATASVLVAELERAITAKEVPAKIGPSVYVSYMMRRGALAPKAN